MKRKTSVLILRAIETVLCLICFGLYIDGAMNDESFPYAGYSCGIYIGFFIYSAGSILYVIFIDQVPILPDAIILLLASLLFIFVSIITMNYAEIDKHLIYLTDEEESKHYFFIICYRQSLCSLSTGLLFGIDSLILFEGRFDNVDE